MTPEENHIGAAVRHEGPPPPICPHCGRGAKNKETCTLSGHGIMMGGFPWIVVTCSGCHKIISVVPMPMPPEPEPQQPQSSLILPRM